MPDEKKHSVLIVDDNPEFAKSLKNLLMDVAGTVISIVDMASNAADGLIAMRSNEYDFVFMDINMPYIDGIEATRFATYEFYIPKTKIIAISFHSENYYREQMQKAGAYAYISKDEIDDEKITELFSLNEKSF